MSVLSESDRRVVTNAIVRARAPRVRMTRTQALKPTPKRVRREKLEPLLFVGLCSWCGAPALLGSATCDAHSDLPALDAATSAVVTHRTHSAVTAEGADSSTADHAPVGAARPPKPNHAPMIRQRSTPAGEEGLHLATTSNGIRRSTYTGSAADATRRVTQ